MLLKGPVSAVPPAPLQCWLCWKKVWSHNVNTEPGGGGKRKCVIFTSCCVNVPRVLTRVVCMSKNLNKNQLSSLACFFFPMWFPSHFMTILWVILEPAYKFFLWAFCKLGFSHPGKGYRFWAVLVWNPRGTPSNGLYTEAPPEVVHSVQASRKVCSHVRAASCHDLE